MSRRYMVPSTALVAAAGVMDVSGATPAAGGVCRHSLVLAPVVAAGVAPDTRPLTRRPMWWYMHVDFIR